MRHQQLTSELQERAMLYAAGALDEKEREEFSRHLDEDDCAVCRAEVRESEAAAQSLAMMLPTQTPSEAVKQRLIARAEAASASSRSRESLRRSRPVFAWGGWLAAAAALVLAGIFFNNNSGLRDEVQSLNARVAELESQMTSQKTKLASLISASTIIDLTGQGATPQASARIFWNKATRRWQVYVENLPSLANDRAYQLWFVPPAPNRPISAEVFNTNAGGSAEFEIAVPPEVTTLMAAAVTVEPAGGSAQPTLANGFTLLGATQ